MSHIVSGKIRLMYTFIKSIIQLKKPITTRGFVCSTILPHYKWIRNMLVGNGIDQIFIWKHFTYLLQTYRETAAEFWNIITLARRNIT